MAYEAGPDSFTRANAKQTHAGLVLEGRVEEGLAVGSAEQIERSRRGTCLFGTARYQYQQVPRSREADVEETQAFAEVGLRRPLRLGRLRRLVDERQPLAHLPVGPGPPAHPAAFERH